MRENCSMGSSFSSSIMGISSSSSNNIIGISISSSSSSSMGSSIVRSCLISIIDDRVNQTSRNQPRLLQSVCTLHDATILPPQEHQHQSRHQSHRQECKHGRQWWKIIAQQRTTTCQKHRAVVTTTTTQHPQQPPHVISYQPPFVYS